MNYFLLGDRLRGMSGLPFSMFMSEVPRLRANGYRLLFIDGEMYAADDNREALEGDALERFIASTLHDEEPTGVPTPKEIYESLPQTTVDKEILKTAISCSVCLAEFCLHDPVKQLPCKHYFHTDCIEPWLKENSTCPICRNQIVPRKRSSGPDVIDLTSPPERRASSDSHSASSVASRSSDRSSSSGSNGAGRAGTLEAGVINRMPKLALKRELNKFGISHGHALGRRELVDLVRLVHGWDTLPTGRCSLCPVAMGVFIPINDFLSLVAQIAPCLLLTQSAAALAHGHRRQSQRLVHQPHPQTVIGPPTAEVLKHLSKGPGL